MRGSTGFTRRQRGLNRTSEDTHKISGLVAK